MANLELEERRTMEGPKVPSEARGAGAPRGWGMGSKFKKINIEIAYFSSFLQSEMVSSALFSAVSVRNY